MTTVMRHQHTVLLIPDRLATADDWARLPEWIVELGVIGVYFDCALWSREPGPDQYVPRDKLAECIAELWARGRRVGPHVVLPAAMTDGAEQYAELRRMLARAADLFGAPPMVYCDGAERHQFGARAYVEEILSGLGPRPDLIECSAERDCLDLITAVGNVDVVSSAEVGGASDGTYQALLASHMSMRFRRLCALRDSGFLAGSGHALRLAWMGGVQGTVDQPMRMPWSRYWIETLRHARLLGAGVTARVTVEGLARMDRLAFRAAMEGR